MSAMLRQIREGEVPAELAGNYADIRHCLRTSFVPLLFRAIAPQRQALRILWRTLRPNVVTRFFEEASDDLRAHIANLAVDMGTPLIEPVLLGEGLDVDDLDDVRAQVDIFHYVDPKVLLCAATLHRVLEAGTAGGVHARPDQLLTIPEGEPPGMARLALLPENGGGVADEVVSEILTTTHLPATEADLRAFGRWPNFLEVAWREVSPVFRHAGLEEALESIRDEAENAACRLPYAMELPEKELRERGIERAALLDTVRVFFDALPRLALFAAALKVALDGAQDALDSPFPLDLDEEQRERFDEESALR